MAQRLSDGSIVIYLCYITGIPLGLALWTLAEKRVVFTRDMLINPISRRGKSSDKPPKPGAEKKHIITNTGKKLEKVFYLERHLRSYQCRVPQALRSSAVSVASLPENETGNGNVSLEPMELTSRQRIRLWSLQASTLPSMTNLRFDLASPSSPFLPKSAIKLSTLSSYPAISIWKYTHGAGASSSPISSATIVSAWQPFLPGSPQREFRK